MLKQQVLEQIANFRKWRAREIGREAAQLWRQQEELAESWDRRVEERAARREAARAHKEPRTTPDIEQLALFGGPR